MSAPTRRGTGARRRSGGQSRGSWVGLRLPSLPRLLVTEVTLAAIAVVAVLAGVGVESALWILVPVAVVPFLTVGGRGVVDWAATTVRFLSGSSPATGFTVDHTESDGTSFGVHRRDCFVSCVLELRPPVGTITELGRSTASTEAALDPSVLVPCLVQHDITVAAIDIVSHGMRTVAVASASEVYEQLIGPLPAVSTRRVWITVTVDVRLNTSAIDARGGGLQGAARTIGIASERVARVLESQGISSHMLPRSEIDAVAGHMCRGVGSEDLTQNWRSAPLPGVVSRGHGLDFSRLDDAALVEIWATPTVSTSTALRLRGGAEHDDVRVGGSCRFVTRTTAPTPPIPRAVSMNGRQRDAVLTSLPLAIGVPYHDEPVRTLRLDRLRALHIPVAGCGQLLGSDSAGRGVAARIHGIGVRTVHVAGELYLAQQLIFRAIATGARVVVRTDRPHAWGSLVDSVGAPDRIRIDGGPTRPGTGVDLEVSDFSGLDAPGDRPRSRVSTTLILSEHVPRSPMPDPDLSIVQPGAAGDRIHVRSSRREVELMLVTIPQETAFIGRPRVVPRSNAY